MKKRTFLLGPDSRHGSDLEHQFRSAKLQEEDEMATATAFPHITLEPGEPARLQNHPRTRVAMIVMDYLARGFGPEDLVRHYPYLNLAEVHAAMAYYHDHQIEIDSEIQAELDQLESGPNTNASSPVWLKLKAKVVI